ncbi:MAG TPA: hypothetical protein VKB47_11590 [Terracidiphilus sp.]|nr:hypothetical protein [Terracidiphilus sp.]
MFAQQQVVRGEIPFNFTVGEKVLPAGEYIVVPQGNHSLKIQSVGGWNWTIVTGSQSYHDASDGSRLEFDRIGESYFLHRVLCPSLTALNIDVPLRRSEKTAREQASLLSNAKVLLVLK